MQSATVLGRELGLGAQELNIALKEAGLQTGKPGAWALTERGKKYAVDQWHHRGPGGSSIYNRDWETRRWKEGVLDLLGDMTPDRRQQLRDTVAGARRASRAAAAEVLPAVTSSAASARDASGVALRTANPLHAIVAGVAVYGLFKAASAISHRRAAHASPRTPDDAADPEAPPPGDADPYGAS